MSVPAPVLSAIVLTQNVAGLIERCVRSLSFADEIIVVDAESTDGTDDIARSLGATVVTNPWPGFGAQRRFGLERARGDWILMCDSDEVATEELGREIRTTIDEGGATLPDGFRIQRKNHYMGRHIRHGPWARDDQLRLFRAGKGRVSDKSVHEGVVVEGSTPTLRATLLHYTHHSLADSIARINRYSTLEAQDRVGRRRIGVFDPLFPPIGVFLNYYVRQGCWRDGMPGFYLSVTTAMYKCLLYVKIFALQRGIGSSSDSPSV